MRYQKSNKYRRCSFSKHRKPKGTYKRSRLVEILPSSMSALAPDNSESKDRRSKDSHLNQRKKLFKKHLSRWKHNRLNKKSPMYPPILQFSPKPRNSFGLLNFDLCSICTDEDWLRSTDYFGSFSSVSQNMEKCDFSDPS